MSSSVTNLSTSFKALKINADQSKFGSFAEIGAGQEVARHFFQAGHASGTIAKSMSAYDMTFSDEIYGKEESGRYVCESRLHKMLDKEFEHLDNRLKKSRGKDTLFFAFANTVATNSGHGWMGIKLQLSPLSPPSSIVLHVKMLDTTRLQQAEVLGVLGVNLLYGAFELQSEPNKFITSLTDNISRGRVEIDLIRFSGPDFEKIDNRLMCLELVEQGLTNQVVFNPQGESSTAAEEFFQKSIFLLRGEFRPITKVNLSLLNAGIEQFKTDYKEIPNFLPHPVLEITMANLKSEKGIINKKDFLERVDTLSHLGLPVMITNYKFYYEVKQSLREITKLPIGFVLGGDHLEYFFNDENYTHLQGGIFQAAAQLFDIDTKIYIYPYKTNDACKSLSTFFSSKSNTHLISYLKEKKNLSELSNCDKVESSFLSSHVRSLLLKDNPSWKDLVPEKVKDLIEKNGLFRR